VIDTGIRLNLPSGTEGQVRPRSGLAAKYGITVLNSPGTIDSGYRGEVKVILINHGSSPYVVKVGDRIAQLVFARVLDTALIQVEEISDKDTPRSSKGFGSSGVSTASIGSDKEPDMSPGENSAQGPRKKPVGRRKGGSSLPS
jgi:dUTP pyrophosphatase